ncbi:MAG: hypothetical protein R3A10_01335 [Caldilineaceae bacterium]
MPIGNAGRLQSPAQHYGPSRDSRVRKACSGQSGVSGGYVFFMRDHRLHYIYNYMGIKEFTVSSSVDVTPGAHTLRYEFEPTGAAEPRQEARHTRPWPTLHRRRTRRRDRHPPDRAHHVRHRGVELRLRFRRSGLPCVPRRFAFTGKLDAVTVDLWPAS